MDMCHAHGAAGRPAARDRIDFRVNSSVMSICARIPEWPTLDATARRKMSMTAAERARRLELCRNAFVAVENRLRLARTRPGYHR